MASELLKTLQENRKHLEAQVNAVADKHGTEAWNVEEWDRVNAAYDENLKELEAEQGAEKLRESEAIRNRKSELDEHAKSLNVQNRFLGRDGGSVTDRRSLAQQAEDFERDQCYALQGWFLNQLQREPRARDYVKNEHFAAATRLNQSLAPNSDFCIHLHPTHKLGAIRNTLGRQDFTKGGALMSETFINSLEEAQLAYGGILQVADIMRTSTAEPIRWPTANDTTNSGSLVGESAAVAAATDPAFAQVTWNAWKYTSNEIYVPFELLRDSPFDLGAMIGRMLGTRLGRAQATDFCTGSGASRPYGIVTRATLGVTAAAQGSIAFDELIDLEHSIDPALRTMGCRYAFHDNVLKALRKLKDGEGRYLWQAGANTGAPDTLNTYPYTIVQEMASSIATTAKTVLFGQLSAYKVRQVNQVRLYRLTERARNQDQDVFLAFVESDGNLLNAGDNPVKYLQQA